MPTHWWAGKKCIQHAVWLKAMTRDLNNPLGDIQPLSIPLFIFQRASEYMERERVPHVFPWRWGNGVLWACAGPWLFACWRDRSSLPGHFASYPPLVLSAVHSFAVRNALDGIPQAAWPLPYCCWLQTLTLLSPPSLDQSTPPTPASPMGSSIPPCTADPVAVHGLITQHPFFLRTEGCQESLSLEPLCLTAQKKSYSRPETATLKACLQGLVSVNLDSGRIPTILTNKNEPVSLNSLCK